MRIINQTQNTIVAKRAALADTMLSRLVGLLNRRSLDADEGLVITQCRSIHMFFMKFAIDVIFVDRKGIVVGLVPAIKPFGMSPYFWRADRAIEVPVGTISVSQTQAGDKIVFEEAQNSRG